MARNKEPKPPDFDRLIRGYRDRISRVTLEIPELEALGEPAAAGGPPAEEARPSAVPPGEAPERAASESEAPPAEAAPAEPAGAAVSPAEPVRASVQSGTAAGAGASRPADVSEPSPRPSWTLPAFSRGAWRRRLGRLLAVGATAAVSVAGVRQWRARLADQLHRSVPLPYAHTVGLAVHDGLLSSVDYERMLLYTFKPDPADTAQVAGIEKLANASAAGLAWGKDSVWSTDAAAGIIYQHRADPGHSVLKTYENRDRSPAAVYWDGAYLWTGDARTETVYQYTVGESLVAFNQFGFPGVVPAGIYAADGVLWVLDSVTRRILRYQIKALAIPQDSLSLEAWLPPSSKAAGFVVDGDILWVVTERPAALHRIDLRLVAWTPK